MPSESGPSSDETLGDTATAATLSVGADAVTVVPPSTEERRADTVGSARTTVLPRVAEVEGVHRLTVDARPRFEQVGSLGAGGMGEVTLVQDHDIGRQVALKRLRGGEGDAGAIARFAQEVRTVGRLEHPNIVPIHDVGVDAEGQHYFVMKYVEGDTLETIIKRLSDGDPSYVSRYTNAHRVQICLEILRAVQYAHSHGIIHRDLKPANIMVGRYGEAMLMDWGLAKPVARKDPGQGDVAPKLAPATPLLPKTELRPNITQAGALLGTPAYMSPEQARSRNDELDERSDIYALGVVFYEVFCLRHPRSEDLGVAELLLAIMDEPITLSRLFREFQAAGAPVAVAHFLRPALAQAPADRYPSVESMIARLEAVRDGRAPIQCHLTFLARVLGGLGHAINTYPNAALVGLVATTGFIIYSLARLAFRLVGH